LGGEATLKGIKCKVTVTEESLVCTDTSKAEKPIKRFFPLALHRIAFAKCTGNEVILHAATQRKGKAGSKIKKIVFLMSSSTIAKALAEGLISLIYKGIFHSQDIYFFSFFFLLRNMDSINFSLNKTSNLTSIFNIDSFYFLFYFIFFLCIKKANLL